MPLPIRLSSSANSTVTLGAAASMYTSCMKTSMRIESENRDRLARIATRELGGVSMDEALRVVLFEHETRVAIARLASDPELGADYLAEATELADVDTSIAE